MFRKGHEKQVTLQTELHRQRVSQQKHLVRILNLKLTPLEIAVEPLMDITGWNLGSDESHKSQHVLQNRCPDHQGLGTDLERREQLLEASTSICRLFALQKFTCLSFSHPVNILGFAPVFPIPVLT